MYKSWNLGVVWNLLVMNLMRILLLEVLRGGGCFCNKNSIFLIYKVEWYVWLRIFVKINVKDFVYG